MHWANKVGLDAIFNFEYLFYAFASNHVFIDEMLLFDRNSLPEICAQAAIYAGAPIVYFSPGTCAKAFASASPAPFSTEIDKMTKELDIESNEIDFFLFIVCVPIKSRLLRHFREQFKLFQWIWLWAHFVVFPQSYIILMKLCNWLFGIFRIFKQSPWKISTQFIHIIIALRRSQLLQIPDCELLLHLHNYDQLANSVRAQSLV